MVVKQNIWRELTRRLLTYILNYIETIKYRLWLLERKQIIVLTFSLHFKLKDAGKVSCL